MSAITTGRQQPETLLEYLRGAEAAASGVLQRVEQMRHERDEALISRAVVHGVLDNLVGLIMQTSDESDSELHQFLAEAQEAVDDGAWSGLLRQFEQMQDALNTIAQGKGNPRQIAIDALDDLGNSVGWFD